MKKLMFIFMLSMLFGGLIVASGAPVGALEDRLFAVGSRAVRAEAALNETVCAAHEANARLKGEIAGLRADRDRQETALRQLVARGNDDAAQIVRLQGQVHGLRVLALSAVAVAAVSTAGAVCVFMRREQ